MFNCLIWRFARRCLESCSTLLILCIGLQRIFTVPKRLQEIDLSAPLKNCRGNECFLFSVDLLLMLAEKTKLTLCLAERVDAF